MYTSRFIKLHQNTKPLILNCNNILSIFENDNNESYIIMKDISNIIVDESVEKIYEKLPKL